MGTGLIVLLHALRLPQPSDPVRLTLSESVRERAFSYFLALAGVFTWHGVWCGAVLAFALLSSLHSL